MAMIKCKMCGGELVLAEDISTATCEYCGSVQTVPKADDEKKLLQFERAEKLRKACDFDKAAGIYESIVADFREEAEAYWGLVLCKFGIEYVDDPATGKKIPTCHRSSFDSILEDSNFEQAMENADLTAQRVYRQEAKEFERLRKQILEVSSTEQPYDIFICYKETDEKGDRTLDSVLAQDLYTALTDKGYRVFFSRITLQGKLGEAYEPYIFAALNSAKVMLAVGTCYEYYNAVWVKNEWSRFLKLMAKDKDKHLIPCYRDLDPEDMPKEFNHLQGADLSKMGAVQDILFNMEKYIPLKKETETVIRERVVVGSDSKVDSMLDRGNMALEDGEWDKADSFFEDVLNLDSKNAQAYLGKALAKAHCRTLATLIRKRKDAGDMARQEAFQLPVEQARIDQAVKNYTVPGYLEAQQLEKLYETDRTYYSKVASRRSKLQAEKSYWAEDKLLSKAMKFATGAVEKKLKAEVEALLSAFENWLQKAQEEESESYRWRQENYSQHLEKADAQAKKLWEKATARREEEYQQLAQLSENSQNIAQLQVAAETLESMGGYLDSKRLAQACRQKAAAEQKKKDDLRQQQLQQQRQEAAAKSKKILVIVASVLIAFAAIVIAFVLIKDAREKSDYRQAVALYDSGDYVAAEAAFRQMGQYADCEEMVLKSRLAEARRQMSLENYDQATQLLKALQKDTGDIAMRSQISELLSQIENTEEYLAACALLEENRFMEAREAFLAMQNQDMVKECQYRKLEALLTLFKEFELHEVFVYFDSKVNGELFFCMPAAMDENEKTAFENAYKAAIADPYEIGSGTVKHTANTDIALNDTQERRVKGFFAPMLEAAMENLGDYKDAKAYVTEIREIRYAYAVSKMEFREFFLAKSLFDALGEYKDSAEKSQQCINRSLATAKKGDVLEFGVYEDKALTWKVLDRKGDSVLMITESCVTERKYQKNQNDPKYYKDSPIRNFLNDTFYKKAFTAQQQEMIQKKTLSTTGGNVSDKIFLLSDKEAKQYFNSDAERKSADGKEWFLRTVNQVKLAVLNYKRPIAMTVTGEGKVYQLDWTTDYARGVRPAMWIDVSSYGEK